MSPRRARRSRRPAHRRDSARRPTQRARRAARAQQRHDRAVTAHDFLESTRRIIARRRFETSPHIENVSMYIILNCPGCAPPRRGGESARPNVSFCLKSSKKKKPAGAPDLPQNAPKKKNPPPVL